MIIKILFIQLMFSQKKCKLFNIELTHRINNSIEHFSEKVLVKNKKISPQRLILILFKILLIF